MDIPNLNWLLYLVRIGMGVIRVQLFFKLIEIIAIWDYVEMDVSPTF